MNPTNFYQGAKEFTRLGRRGDRSGRFQKLVASFAPT
jgi:hypothetical protein